MNRRVKIAAVTVVVAVATSVVGFMGYRELAVRGLIRLNEYDIRAEGTLRVGDLAPDLPLTVVGGGEMRLSELWAAKPLVLVFGSYT